MIRVSTNPVSENFKEAEIQDESRYSSFMDQTNLALRQDRFSLLSRKTFDRKTKRELKRKRSIPILRFTFWGSSLSALALFFASNFPNLTVFRFIENASQSTIKTPFAFCLGGLIIGTGIWLKYLKNSPDSHDIGGLTEEANDLEKANILIKWGQNIIENKIPLFIKNIPTGKIYHFSETLQNRRNNIMSLLGDNHHRKCLNVRGYIPNGAILHLKDNEEEIFKPLRDAIETLNTQTQDLKSPPPEKPEFDLGDVVNAKIKNQKDTNRKLVESPRKRIPRRYRHFQTALLKEKMCKLVVKKFQEPAYYHHEIKANGTRVEWFRALSIISQNPKKWRAFSIDPEKWIYFSQNPEKWKTFSKNQTDEKNKEDEEIIKFTKKLFGPTGLNTKKRTRQLNFIYGENHYLNHLIKETGVIPEDELVPQSTTLKKKKRNLI